VIFTLASLVTGLAQTLTLLLGSRIAQGVGAALLFPAALATITSSFHGQERNKALSIWAADDRAQARLAPAPSWLGLSGHGAGGSLGRICPHQFDETEHRTMKLASPDIPGGCVVVLVRRTPPSSEQEARSRRVISRDPRQIRTM
jgi:hypothetical protein